MVEQIFNITTTIFTKPFKYIYYTLYNSIFHFSTLATTFLLELLRSSLLTMQKKIKHGRTLNPFLFLSLTDYFNWKASLFM